MSAPKCSLVGRDVPKDGRAFVAMDADTGELFAVVSLADWGRIAADAKEYGPCTDGDRGEHASHCSAPGCELARRVLRIAAEVAS